MKALDLPVRKVNVFGHGLVIPNDTICLVYFKYGVNGYSDYKGVPYGKLSFTVIVELRHSHFGETGGNLFQWEAIASTERTPWLRRVITRPILRKETSYLRDKVLGSLAWGKVEKKFQKQKIRDLILDMFLDGKVSSAPLLKYFPEMS
jgi:hypothetical protein